MAQFSSIISEHRTDEAELLVDASRKDLAAATGLSHQVVYSAFPQLAPDHVKAKMEYRDEQRRNARANASSAIHTSLKEANHELREITEKLRENEAQHSYLMDLRERAYGRLR